MEIVKKTSHLFPQCRDAPLQPRPQPVPRQEAQTVCQNTGHPHRQQAARCQEEIPRTAEALIQPAEEAGEMRQHQRMAMIQIDGETGNGQPVDRLAPEIKTREQKQQTQTPENDKRRIVGCKPCDYAWLPKCKSPKTQPRGNQCGDRISSRIDTSTLSGPVP